MRSRAAAMLGCAAMLVAAACGGGPIGAQGPPRKVVRTASGGQILALDIRLAEVNGSGVTGLAKMQSTGRESGVLTVTLHGAPKGPLSMHIHPGPCFGKSDLRPRDVTHYLEPAINGLSKTDLGTTAQGLTHGEFHIAVHADNRQDSKHVACGNTRNKTETDE